MEVSAAHIPETLPHNLFSGIWEEGAPQNSLAAVVAFGGQQMVWNFDRAILHEEGRRKGRLKSKASSDCRL
jgi:hypothetical protein